MREGLSFIKIKNLCSSKAAFSKISQIIGLEKIFPKHVFYNRFIFRMYNEFL